MEKIMTNGFCELNENEMMEVEGGANGYTVLSVLCGIGAVVGVGAAIVITGGTLTAAIPGALALATSGAAAACPAFAVASAAQG